MIDDEDSPAILVATTKGTIRKHRLTIEEDGFREGELVFQDEGQRLISDFAVTKRLYINDTVKQMHVVLAIGNGEVIVLRLRETDGQVQTQSQQSAEELAREKICDIKLLSCFIVTTQDNNGDNFDIFAANGRSELVKATFDGQRL